MVCTQSTAGCADLMCAPQPPRIILYACLLEHLYDLLTLLGAPLQGWLEPHSETNQGSMLIAPLPKALVGPEQVSAAMKGR